jgi:hypothetical protein
MKNIKNNSWYTVMISLLIIWFLLVLTTGIFNLILNELKDNKSLWDYMKSYAWAEAWSELALLQIKNNWYEYYDKIDHSINNKSILLSQNNLNISNFKKQKDVLLSYDMQTKTNNYSWELKSLWYDIIPLFYIDEDLVEQKIDNYSITILGWTISDLSWNIIWKDKWLSWVWTNTSWILKSIDASWNFSLSTQNIYDFLDNSDSNYLVLFNSNNSDSIKYKIESSDFFIKPKTSIISSASVWNYKQNISTKLDNTEFLNMLKYSIYSN